MFAGQCPRCCSPLLQSSVCFETDDEKMTCEEQVYLCVQCKKVVVANFGKLIPFFETTRGSLILLSNPFDVPSAWSVMIREKIAEYVFLFLSCFIMDTKLTFLYTSLCIRVYKYFISQNTLVDIDKVFPEANAFLNAVEGDDILAIQNLLNATRKVLVTLYLGEIFCKKSIASIEHRIAELKQIHSQETMPKLIQLLMELASSKMKILSMEDDLKQRYGSEYSVSESVAPLERQITSLESRMEDSASQLNTATLSLQNDIDRIVSQLLLIQIAATFAYNRLQSFAELTFESTMIVGKCIEIIEVMSECVKVLVQDYVPESIPEDLIHHKDDILDMKSLHEGFVSSATKCCSCLLPVIYNKDMIMSSCVFCGQEIPSTTMPAVVNDLIVTDHELDGARDIPLEICRSSELGSDVSDDLECANEDAPSKITSVVDLSNPVTGLKIIREVGKRLAQGWMLIDKTLCSNCGLQKMCNNNDRSTNVCLLCDVVLKDEDENGA